MSGPEGSAAARSSPAAGSLEAPLPRKTSLASRGARLSSPLLLDSLDAKSITVLAQLFYRGESGCPKDEERAFHLWRHAAVERQYPQAQYWLGTAYCLGVGVEEDFCQGKKWLERAAAAGDYLALYNLGCMHFQGDGCPVDVPKAKQLWEKARQLGSAEATLALAQMARRSRSLVHGGQSGRPWNSQPHLEIKC